MITEKNETYAAAVARHQKESNAFEGVFFAFSNDQFYKGLQTVGLNRATYPGKIQSLCGTGGFILKSRAPVLSSMFKRHEAETNQARKSEKFLFESLIYELENHEYGYTYDATEALEALGLTAADLPGGMLKKATAKALEGFDA